MSIDYPELRFYIDGKWIPNTSSNRDSIKVVNPSDGSFLGSLPVATDDDIDQALDAARRAQHVWRNTSPIQRSTIILTACQLIRERVDYIASLSATELGTPIAEARNYVRRGADFMEWDANEGRRLYGQVIPSDIGLRQTATPEPIGVVAAFSPWNGPALVPCRKIGSALAAGCAIILKAAEETPASAMAIIKSFEDAGLPAGVANLIFGNPGHISTRLIEAQEVRLVTFTGSVTIGKRLAEAAARLMKPVIMELGGHAPVIVCEDADIEIAALRCATAKFRNGGQACIAPTRFYIHESVYNRFQSAFLRSTRDLKIGTAFDEGITFGPLGNERRLHAVESLVNDAVERGATTLCGGRRIDRPGFYFAPTILENVPEDAKIWHEEPFGPVACLTSYRDLDLAIDKANKLSYGLAAYVYTRDAARADRISRELQCGAVAINHCIVSSPGIPFGGVKDSGFGREGGSEGVRGYTVIKTITHQHQ